jgi:predicted nucleic acid-binding protein
MIVVDASAVLSILLGEPMGEVVLRALQGGAQGSRSAPASGNTGPFDRIGPPEPNPTTRPAATLIAPDFLALEVANSVVQMRRRARRLGLKVPANSVMGVPAEGVAEAIRSHFEAMEVTLEPFPFRLGFARVCELSERYSLTSYDALYVALAEQRGAQLLTLDRAMAAAAAGIGITPVIALKPDAN